MPGLELVGYIRRELKNDAVRIILRTGQPGQAPERQVIVDYDINDYKAKTELTADKLFTSLTAALRSYQQFHRMVETRRGLEIIIEGASTLYDFKSMQRLAEGVLTQIASLLNVDCGGILVLRDAGGSQEHFSVLAGSGCYRRFAGARPRAPSIPMLERRACSSAFERRSHNSSPSFRCSISTPRASARSWSCWRPQGRCPPPTGRWSRCSAAAFRSPSTTSSSTTSCTRPTSGWRSACASAPHELTAANQRLASQWSAAAPARTSSRTRSSAPSRTTCSNPLGVILGRAEMMNELVTVDPVQIDKIKDQLGHIRGFRHAN